MDAQIKAPVADQFNCAANSGLERRCQRRLADFAVDDAGVFDLVHCLRLRRCCVCGCLATCGCSFIVTLIVALATCSSSPPPLCS